MHVFVLQESISQTLNLLAGRICWLRQAAALWSGGSHIMTGDREL